MRWEYFIVINSVWPFESGWEIFSIYSGTSRGNFCKCHSSDRETKIHYAFKTDRHNVFIDSVLNCPIDWFRHCTELWSLMYCVIFRAKNVLVLRKFSGPWWLGLRSNQARLHRGGRGELVHPIMSSAWQTHIILSSYSDLYQILVSNTMYFNVKLSKSC